MNILIIGLTTTKNVGNSAIIYGMVEQLRTTFPGARFRVLATRPDPVKFGIPPGVEQGREFEVTSFPPGRLRGALWYALRTFWLLTLRLFGKTIGLSAVQRQAVRWYKDASLIVYNGGANLTTVNGVWWEGVPAKLVNILLAKALRKGVVIHTASIGPFPPGLRSVVARFALNKVDLISARESFTRQYLHSLGVNKPKIIEAADAAFSCPAATKERGVQLWSNHRIQLPRKRALIGLALRYWFYADGSSGAAKWEEFVSVCGEASELIGQEFADLVFLTTMYSGKDFSIATEIQECMTEPSFLKISTKEYDARDVKAMYASLDVLVTSRLHALILAVSSLTPVVCITCLPKLTEMMHELGLDEYCIPIEELTACRLVALVRQAYRHRTIISKQLSGRLRDFQKQAFYCAEEIARLCVQKGENKSFASGSY